MLAGGELLELGGVVELGGGGWLSAYGDEMFGVIPFLLVLSVFLFVWSVSLE